jgi:hypothetical protein
MDEGELNGVLTGPGMVISNVGIAGGSPPEVPAVSSVRPRALVTLGVLSTGICDLLQVVLADGSTGAFSPHLLFSAGGLILSSISTLLALPVASSVNPARRLPIHDVSSADLLAGLAGHGFGIASGTAVALDAGPTVLGFFSRGLPSAKSSSKSSSV